MDPADFLAVAARLKESANEAELRTSIGRSYYALFNSLLVSLGSRGVVFSGQPEDHRRLVSYLSKAKHWMAARVARALQDLREERRIADYEMQKVVDDKKTKFAFEKANKALGDFNRIPPLELDQIATRIQKMP